MSGLDERQWNQVVKITIGSAQINMDNIQGCKEISDIENKEIDWCYCDVNEENPTFRYFAITTDNKTRILKVSGKVELINIPIPAEEIVHEWD